MVSFENMDRFGRQQNDEAPAELEPASKIQPKLPSFQDVSIPIHPPSACEAALMPCGRVQIIPAHLHQEIESAYLTTLDHQPPRETLPKPRNPNQIMHPANPSPIQTHFNEMPALNSFDEASSCAVHPGSYQYLRRDFSEPVNPDYPPQYSAYGIGDTVDPRTKRRRLSKQTTNVLHQWLCDHTDHPYPTDQERQTLLKLTGLSRLQLR